MDEYQRKSVPLTIRMEVFAKYEYRCAACGDDPSNGTTRLEIDHIVPVSMGGSNYIDNLQCLCRDCNAGKGNRDDLTPPIPPLQRRDMKNRGFVYNWVRSGRRWVLSGEAIDCEERE